MSYLRITTWICTFVIGLGVNFTPAQQQPNLADLFQGLMQGASEENAAAKPLIDKQNLKEALPEQLPGMKRISRSAEKTGALGMSVSFAEATFRSEEGGTITIKISDMGGVGGLGTIAQAGFAMQDVDRETETGYELSTTHEGYKAMEEYDNKYETGSFVFMAEGRLNFEIKGRKATMEQIKGAVDLLDISSIVALIPKAVTSEQSTN